MSLEAIAETAYADAASLSCAADDSAATSTFSVYICLKEITLAISTPTLSFGPDEKTGYRLRAEMLVDLPREQVFDFFSDASKLEQITPPWLNFSVLTPMPVEIHEGLLLDYKLKLHRIPIKWQTEICVWEPSVRFVDRQLKGPYRLWYHEHRFEEVDGKTLVRDDVHYIPRGGKLIHRLFVQPDLEKIFRFRQDRLTEIFAAVIANQSSDQPVPFPLPESSYTGVPAVSQTEPSREFNS